MTNVAVLILLSGYQTLDQIRAAGRDELIAHLRRHGALHTAKVADTALAAAARQTVRLPGQDTAAHLVADIATALLQLRRRFKNLDKDIDTAFGAHPQATVIRSLPGMGALVAAEFALAAYAGLAPIAHDSGKRAGNLQRSKRYHRPLRRALFMAAPTTIRFEGPNRGYYQRKPAEGRGHHQALIALARRRVDVLWALLRDNRAFQATPPPKVA